MLELGAGGGLPSLISAVHGAAQVVVTDYPDAELIENLRYNIEHCDLVPEGANITAEVSFERFRHNWKQLIVFRDISGAHQPMT